jgi:18S rRNA (adenine1779-N6/adenine1780-N6)-dimethyltransferase
VNTQLLARVEQLMKVGRNNFRPPPKVESRVVRIEPRNPPPPINFLEWDGMVRLCFNRKNKTLRASFTHKSVLDLLSKNAKTLASLKGAPLAADWDVKATVEAVITAAGFADKRASKLDIDDFLKLLTDMNAAGIHFTA